MTKLMRDGMADQFVGPLGSPRQGRKCENPTATFKDSVGKSIRATGLVQYPDISIVHLLTVSIYIKPPNLVFSLGHFEDVPGELLGSQSSLTTKSK
jgi:hypothetical protein